MPYVSVWVDAPPERNEKAEEAMRVALAKLREGDVPGAIFVLAEATDCPVLKCERQKEFELARLLREWKEQDEPRPDFLTFAHHKRKATAA